MSCEGVYVPTGTTCLALRLELGLHSAQSAHGWKLSWMQVFSPGRYRMAAWKGKVASAPAPESNTLVETSYFTGTVHADPGGNVSPLCTEVQEERGLAAASAMQVA